MNTTQAKRLAIIGISLQGCLGVGYITAGVIMLRMLATIPPDGAVSTAMAHTTGGVANALLAVVIVKPIGLVGLALMTIALVAGKLRERWIFRWAVVCMILWVVMIGVGTIIGAAGLILLFANRKTFGQEEVGLNQGATILKPLP